MVVQLDAGRIAKSTVAIEQRAGQIRLRTVFAHRGSARRAHRAPPADRNERKHDMVPFRDRAHAAADLAHDARRFVPQDHGHHPRPRAVDNGEIGVTQPAAANSTSTSPSCGPSTSISSTTSGFDRAYGAVCTMR